MAAKKLERYSLDLALNSDRDLVRLRKCFRSEGEHVSYEDYEKLQAEFAQYKKDVQTTLDFIKLVEESTRGNRDRAT